MAVGCPNCDIWVHSRFCPNCGWDTQVFAQASPPWGPPPNDEVPAKDRHDLTPQQRVDLELKQKLKENERIAAHYKRLDTRNKQNDAYVLELEKRFWAKMREDAYSGTQTFIVEQLIVPRERSRQQKKQDKEGARIALSLSPVRGWHFESKESSGSIALLVDSRLVDYVVEQRGHSRVSVIYLHDLQRAQVASVANGNTPWRWEQFLLSKLTH